MHGGPRVQNFRISLPSCPVWEKLAAPPKNTRTIISTVRTLGCHHAWPDGRGVGDVGLQYRARTRRVRPRCDTNLYRPVPNLNLVQIQIEKLHPKGNKQLFQEPMYTPTHLSKIYLTIYKFTRRHSDIYTYTSESERGCPIYYCDLTFLGRTEWI